jgi:hypothetical protein
MFRKSKQRYERHKLQREVAWTSAIDILDTKEGRKSCKFQFKKPTTRCQLIPLVRKTIILPNTSFEVIDGFRSLHPASTTRSPAKLTESPGARLKFHIRKRKSYNIYAVLLVLARVADPDTSVFIRVVKVKKSYYIL